MKYPEFLKPSDITMHFKLLYLLFKMVLKSFLLTTEYLEIPYQKGNL